MDDFVFIYDDDDDEELYVQKKSKAWEKKKKHLRRGVFKIWIGFFFAILAMGMETKIYCAIIALLFIVWGVVSFVRSEQKHE